MADEDGAEASEGGGKSKMLLFIIIGVVLIAISIGGTLLAVKMLTPEPEPEAALDQEEGSESSEGEKESEETEMKSAIYYPLKPPIIVNFNARGRQRFMQAEITLMTRDDDVIEAVEIHMPMIRNGLVLLLGGQQYEEIQTESGRELMRQLALKEIQAIMEKEIGKPGIEKLLFTNLVMQ